MTAYFRHHLWDLLCCFVMSTALSLNVFAGYETEDSKASSFLAVGAVCAVCTVLLFIAGYNRRTMLAGIAASVILIVLSIVNVRRFNLSSGESIDQNPALFWIVTVGVSAVCYLLSRWRIGIVLLLAAGSIMSAAFGFLKYPMNLPAFYVFLSAVLVMFLLRVYDASLLSSYTGNVNFTGYAVQSAAFILVTVLGAGLFYTAVIQPLDPPAHPLKLITRLQSLEVLQQVGVSRRTEVQDQDQSTEIENDETKMTDQKQDRDEKKSPQEKRDEKQQGDIEKQTQKEKAQAVNYHRNRTLFYVMLVLLIAVLAAVPFLLRYFLHRRWEQKVKEAGPTDGAVMIYLYLVKKLRYAGFTRPPEVTLFKYMKSQRRAMKSFAAGSSDLFLLTRLYHKILYGCGELDQSEFKMFWKVYENFRKNMRNKIGKIRYALLFFLI